MTGPIATANIFATYLPDHMTLWRGFLDEVSGSGWLPLLLPSPSQKGTSRQPLTIERIRTLVGTVPRHISASGFGLGALPRPCGFARGPGLLPQHLLPR